jgi:hypothetical protein
MAQVPGALVAAVEPTKRVGGMPLLRMIRQKQLKTKPKEQKAAYS